MIVEGVEAVSRISFRSGSCLTGHSWQLLSDTFAKPGWVRISLHPTMTDEEVRLIVESVVAVSRISC